MYSLKRKWYIISCLIILLLGAGFRYGCQWSGIVIDNKTGKPIYAVSFFLSLCIHNRRQILRERLKQDIIGMVKYLADTFLVL